jgi:hypothetical protein
MVRKKWCEERVKRRGEKTEDVCRQRREIVLRVAPGRRWCGKSDSENVWMQVKRCGRCAHDRQPRPPQRKPPRIWDAAQKDLPLFNSKVKAAGDGDDSH